MSWKPSPLTTAPKPGVVVLSSSIAALCRISDESSGSENEQHVLQHQQIFCSAERHATAGPLPMRALTELLSATAEVADQQSHTFQSRKAAVQPNHHHRRRRRHHHQGSPLLGDTPLNTTVAGAAAADGGGGGGYYNAEGAELSLVRQWKWDILLAKRPHDLTDAKATSEWLEEVLAISDTKRSLGATRRAAMLSSTMTNPSTRTPHQERPTNQITTPEMYISDLSDSGGEEAEDVRRYYTTSDAIHHHHKQQHNNNNNKNSSNDHHRHVRRRKQAVMEEDDGGPKIFYNIKEPRQKRRKHRHHYDHQY